MHSGRDVTDRQAHKSFSGGRGILLSLGQLFVVVLDYDTLKELTVALFKESERLAVVGVVLKSLFDELKASIVLVEDFAPRLHANRHFVGAMNEPPFPIGASFEHRLDIVIVFVRDQPKVPPDTVHAVIPWVTRNRQRVIHDLGNLLRCELHLRGFELNDEMLVVVGPMPLLGAG